MAADSHPRDAVLAVAPFVPFSIHAARWAVLYVAWLNQGDIFVGILCAKRIEQTPGDDPSILNHVF
jgi:hypothetical protein